VIAFVGGGLLLAVVWVLVEMRIENPLVEIRVLRRRPVLMTNITAVLVGFAMFASFLLIPQLAQTPERFGYGFSATVTGAGLLMLPSTMVMLFAGPLAGKLAATSPRLPLVLGSLLLGLAFVVYAAAHGTVLEICIGSALTGLGIGFAYASMANLVVESVPADEVGIATGINTIMRTIGGAFGAQLVASLLTAKTIGHTAIPAEAAYTDAFVLGAVASLLAMIAALAIPQPRRPRAQPATAPAAA
jgi:MFS family permease